MNWLDLKKPDELEIKQSEYNLSQAVLEVGPFERGFGVTHGTNEVPNASRRALHIRVTRGTNEVPGAVGCALDQIRTPKCAHRRLPVSTPIQQRGQREVARTRRHTKGLL